MKKGFSVYQFIFLSSTIYREMGGAVVGTVVFWKHFSWNRRTDENLAAILQMIFHHLFVIFLSSFYYLSHKSVSSLSKRLFLIEKGLCIFPAKKKIYFW